MNASNLEHLEVTEYDDDDDEAFVECLSYTDFLSAHEQQNLKEISDQFERLMKDFRDMADETVESLALVSEEALTRILESAERGIAAIKEVSDQTTSSDMIAKEYFEQGAHDDNKIMPDPSFYEWGVPLSEEQAQRLFAIHVAGNPDKKPIGSFLTDDSRLVTWKIVGITELRIVFRRSTQFE